MGGKTNKNRIRKIYRYASSAAALIITGSFALYAALEGEGPNMEISQAPQADVPAQTDVIPDEILPPAASYSDIFFRASAPAEQPVENAEPTEIDGDIPEAGETADADNGTDDNIYEETAPVYENETNEEEIYSAPPALEDIPAEEMTGGAAALELEYLPEEENTEEEEKYASYDEYEYSDGEASGALVSAANASGGDEDDEYDLLSVDAGAADIAYEPEYDGYELSLPEDDYDTYEYEASISEEEDDTNENDGSENASEADPDEADTDNGSAGVWVRPEEDEPEEPEPVYTGISRLALPAGLELDENGVPVNYVRKLTGKSCAYTADPGDLTASGREVFQGYVAVDPDIIPYGTALFIIADDGTVYGYAIAADTGTSVMAGDILIDLYMDEYSDCVSWGARQVTVYILG